MLCSVCAVAPRPPEWKCVPLRGRPGGDGGAEIGHVASTRESKQLETQLGNTYSVSRTCVGVGVELSNFKSRNELSAMSHEA